MNRYSIKIEFQSLGNTPEEAVDSLVDDVMENIQDYEIANSISDTSEVKLIEKDVDEIDY